MHGLCHIHCCGKQTRDVSKLANEIFDFLKFDGSILVAEKSYLKWVLMTCLPNTLDATWKKLHLKCFLWVIIENILDICLILSGKMLTRF